MQYRSRGIQSVAFSPNGNYVVPGSMDNTVRIWEATTGKEVVRKIHNGEVEVVAFTSDGKYISSGGCSLNTINPGELCTRSKQIDIGVWRWQPENLIAIACLVLTRNLTHSE